MGVGQKLNAAVGRAERIGRPWRRRERYGPRSGAGGRETDEGQRQTVLGAEGTFIQLEPRGEAQVSLERFGVQEVAGAPKGAGRKLRVSILPQASVLPLLPRSERGCAGIAAAGWAAEVSCLPHPPVHPGDPQIVEGVEEMLFQTLSPHPLYQRWSYPRLGAQGSQAGGGGGSATPAPHRGRRSSGNRAEEPGGLLPGGLLSRATLLPRG